jgi:hypothetical protein
MLCNALNGLSLSLPISGMSCLQQKIDWSAIQENKILAVKENAAPPRCEEATVDDLCTREGLKSKQVVWKMM